MKYNVNFEIELKKNPYTGLYIALEGIDGSGKTTQVEKLAKHFEKEGREVVKTHEPRRDGVMGELVTSVLTGKAEIPPVAIQYLFAAQRAVFLEEVIYPALEQGKIVITDRCFWSSIPYGLFDRFEFSKDENGERLLAALSVLSMYHEFLAPDFAFFLDTSVETAGKRLDQLGKKAEIYEKSEKLEKIRNGYAFLFEKFPNELIKIDGELPPEKVLQSILDNVNSKTSK